MGRRRAGGWTGHHAWLPKVVDVGLGEWKGWRVAGRWLDEGMLVG